MRDRLQRRLSAHGNAFRFEAPSLADSLAARARRPLDRRFLREAGALDALEELGRTVRAAAPPADGPHVLIASLRAWPDHQAYEALIAAALRMRGARITLLTCGGGLPLCEMGSARRAWPRPCDRCAAHTSELAERLGVDHETLGGLLPWGADGRRAPAGDPAEDPQDRREVSRAWILRTSTPEDAPDVRAVEADLAAGVAGVAGLAPALLDRLRPDVLFAVNGLFAPEQALRAEALSRGIRCPTYEISPRKGALVFAQRTLAPHHDNDEAWRRVGDRPLTPAQRAAIVELLEGRARGVGAHERYFGDVDADVARLRARLGIPDGARMATLFTNMTWDSAVLGRHVGFDGMVPFVECAVQEAAEVDGLHLVVRVHPAEVRWRTRERVEEALRRSFGPDLPASVHVVPPGESVDSYALMDASDLVLGYTTTVGLEAATRGRPVLVGGDTHYRGRGFTHDLAGPEDLRRLLRDPPAPPTPAEHELALRYAFTFFFRGFVPVAGVRVEQGRVTEVDGRLERLRPGADPHLDWIADRILDGEPFVLPDELALPDAA